MTLQQLVEFASDFVEKRFGETGEIRPMFHCVRRTGEHFVLPAPFRDKDAMAIAARAICEKYDVTQVMFIDEAWRAEAIGDEQMRQLQQWLDEHDGRLDGYPHCVECVVISAEDISGRTLCAQRRIFRDGDKPRLGPLEIDEEITSSEGRFVGLLPGQGKAN
jgi:hypothetical protein